MIKLTLLQTIAHSSDDLFPSHETVAILGTFHRRDIHEMEGR